MQAAFWHRKWQDNEIGFHEAAPNGLLVEHLERLAAPGARLFLPLCGKTRDIGYLLGRGMQVVGAELSELAVAQLFDDLGMVPERIDTDAGYSLRGDGVEIFVGDFFALQPAQLGAVDAVYDRAALVAMPGAMRGRYAEQLSRLADDAAQLLIAFEYDQARMGGPPFSVDAAEVARLYGQRYRHTVLARQPVEGRLKARCDAIETAWLLTPRPAPA